MRERTDLEFNVEARRRSTVSGACVATVGRIRGSFAGTITRNVSMGDFGGFYVSSYPVSGTVAQVASFEVSYAFSQEAAGAEPERQAAPVEPE